MKGGERRGLRACSREQRSVQRGQRKMQGSARRPGGWRGWEAGAGGGGSGEGKQRAREKDGRDRGGKEDTRDELTDGEKDGVRDRVASIG